MAEDANVTKDLDQAEEENLGLVDEAEAPEDSAEPEEDAEAAEWIEDFWNP